MISVYESFHRQMRPGSIWTQLQYVTRGARPERVEVVSVKERFQDVMEVGETTKMVKRSLGIFVSFKIAGSPGLGNREMKLEAFLYEYGMI